MKTITITIDGPASSGKGTTAKGVAEKLGYRYLDSGALYRGVSLFMIRNEVVATDTEQVRSLLSQIELDFTTEGHLLLNGQDVESDIRTIAINERVSTGEARNQDVRDFVTTMARAMAAGKGYVLDGRDAATHLAPDAELKVYLDCDVHIRGARRALEYGQTSDSEIQAMTQLLQTRDLADKQVLQESRAACNAEVDTSELDIDEQIDRVVQLALERINAGE